MNAPRKAFILAAGFGTRLQPMTHATPKPLMPIWNEPMLAHTLRMLESWGVQEAIVNAHHLPEAIQAWAQTYSGPISLTVAVEAEILGTGGALRPAAPLLGSDPFWLVNGDIAASLPPEPLIEAFEQSNRFAATWLEDKKGPRTVEMDPYNRITCYQSPTPGVKHTYTLCGVHLLTADILRYLPASPFSSIVDAYTAAMYANRFVHGAVIPASYWNDGGTPADYLAIHRETQKRATLGQPGREYYTSAHTPPHTLITQACAHLHWPIPQTIAIPLGRRGSARTFWRLVNGSKSAIAIGYETSRLENTRYAATDRHLASLGVNVPKILADDPSGRLLILQDCGDDSLERRANTPAPDLIPLYTPPLQQLALLHTRGLPAPIPLEPPFDTPLYHWELNLFQEHFSHEPLPPPARAELEQGIQTLLAQPPTLTHRDFQSSNILFKNKKAYLIDFQGMRPGPAAYDLASLLFDPYAPLTPDHRQALLHIYNQHAAPITPHTLHIAAAQRLLQALGAFGRLTAAGQKRFATYIPQALLNLRAAAQYCAYTHLDQYLQRFTTTP